MEAELGLFMHEMTEFFHGEGNGTYTCLSVSLCVVLCCVDCVLCIVYCVLCIVYCIVFVFPTLLSSGFASCCVCFCFGLSCFCSTVSSFVSLLVFGVGIAFFSSVFASFGALKSLFLGVIFALESSDLLR